MREESEWKPRHSGPLTVLTLLSFTAECGFTISDATDTSQRRIAITIVNSYRVREIRGRSVTGLPAIPIAYLSIAS